MKTAVTGEADAEGIVYNRSLIDLGHRHDHHGSGDKVVQRPLAFYEAVGRVLAREGRP